MDDFHKYSKVHLNLPPGGKCTLLYLSLLKHILTFSALESALIDLTG